MTTRGGGPKPVGDMALRVAARALRRRGFAEPRLLAAWPEVIGGLLADHTAPERIVYPRGQRDNGVLHVRVAGPLALELQHLAPVVVDRINGWFGYRAVARLQLHQGRVAGRAARRPEPAPEDPALRARAEAAVAGIADPALRRALADLGCAVLSRNRPAGAA